MRWIRGFFLLGLLWALINLWHDVEGVERREVVFEEFGFAPHDFHTDGPAAPRFVSWPLLSVITEHIVDVVDVRGRSLVLLLWLAHEDFEVGRL